MDIKIVNIPVADLDAGAAQLTDLYRQGYEIVTTVGGPSTMISPSFLIYTLVRRVHNHGHLQIASAETATGTGEI